MQGGTPQFVFPKPGKTLIGVMIGLFCIWIMFAIGINWAGASPATMEWLVGSSPAVWSGQVWRLVTAPLIHAPNRPGHVITTLLGIYFLGTSLEQRWGGKRMVLFLIGSGAFAFLMQAILGSLITKLDTPVWYGGLGMTTAVAVAWALHARDQQVRLFFILPVSGTMLIGFIFVMSVLYVIANQSPAEGLVTPFGGMLAGYLFGDASPLRRYYLQMRFKQLQAQSKALRGLSTGQSSARRKASGLRVIQGGKSDDDDPPPEKKWLN